MAVNAQRDLELGGKIFFTYFCFPYSQRILMYGRLESLNDFIRGKMWFCLFVKVHDITSQKMFCLIELYMCTWIFYKYINAAAKFKASGLPSQIACMALPFRSCTYIMWECPDRSLCSFKLILQALKGDSQISVQMQKTWCSQLSSSRAMNNVINIKKLEKNCWCRIIQHGLYVDLLMQCERHKVDSEIVSTHILSPHSWQWDNWICKTMKYLNFDEIEGILPFFM